MLLTQKLFSTVTKSIQYLPPYVLFMASSLPPHSSPVSPSSSSPFLLSSSPPLFPHATSHVHCYCDRTLRILYAHIREEVSQKFPENTYKIVGSLMFQRFICMPVICHLSLFTHFHASAMSPLPLLFSRLLVYTNGTVLSKYNTFVPG